MDRKIELENSVREILSTLHSKGEGYIVGGYVRDKLLKLAPEDCDFVTNLDYETVRELFKRYSPKEFGKHFGILEIKYRGNPYEIARYRIDVGTPEDRKLQEVIFTTNIQEDLKRRDFTVNSIAFDGENFVSVPQAFQDLENRIIRFNGNPKERIQEDPLRILRGIRFAVTKDFSLDSPEIYRENMELIKKLSSERIRDEFTKILLSPNVAKGIELLFDLEAINYIIPEFPASNSAAITHQERRKFFSLLEQLSLSKANLIPRLVIFLKLSDLSPLHSKEQVASDHLGISDNNSPIEKILQNLKFNSKTITLVSLLQKNRVENFSKVSERDCRILLSKIGKENLDDFLEILRADIFEKYPEHSKILFKDFKSCFEKIIIENLPLSKRDLKINGKDLNALGYSGKIVGEILDTLLQSVLEDPELNEYEYLEDIVTKYEES